MLNDNDGVLPEDCNNVKILYPLAGKVLATPKIQIEIAGWTF